MQTPAVSVKNPRIVISKLQEARALIARDSPYLQNLLWTIVYYKVTAEELGRLAGFDEPLPTMAITSNGILLYTQEAMDAWTPRQIAAAIEHELWHILSDHAGRTGDRDRMLANVAKDIAINGMLKRGGRDLPPTECTPEFWGFPSGLLWEQYYDLLQQHPLVQRAREKGAGQNRGMSNGKGQESFGQCGSGAGNPLPGEETAKGQGQGQGQDQANEQGGLQAEGRSQDELAFARQQCAQAVAELARVDGGRGIGHVPGGMLRAIEELLKPPVVPWHAKLARRLRRGVTTRPGATDYEHRGASRRMSALKVMGMRTPVTPQMVAPRPKLVVAIDTSGSMGDDALAEAMSEIDGILAAAQDEVSYMSCDTQINSTGKGSSWRDVASRLRGGGGTCIAPIFEYANNLRRDERPNMMVVFTDGGFSDCPETAPQGVDVVWVLVGRHKCRGTTRFGEVIEVPHEDDIEDDV